MQSLIKRYTPPTCTLKIFRTKFTLIPWLSKPSTDNLRFELNIDDPRLPAKEQLTIQGDYQQLQLLATTIEEYLQQFLQSSSLATQNLLQHYLIGDMFPQEKIKLNTSQLFDLANAIAQCQREISQINPRKFSKKTKISLITGISVVSLLITFKVISSQSTVKTTTDTLITSTTISDSQQDRMIINVDVTPPELTRKPQPQLPSAWGDYQKIQPPETVSSPPSDNQPFIPPPPLEIQTGDYQPLPPISPPTSPVIPENLSTPTPPEIPTAISSTQKVQTYFEKRWQPPQELKEKLEYRLILNSQGKIEQMIPLGRVSQDYLNLVKPPKQVKMFNTNGNNLDKIQIRLVLTPQGTVQTFKENN